jgi:lauroyl/myristoyl acyltransferase
MLSKMSKHKKKKGKHKIYAQDHIGFWVYALLQFFFSILPSRLAYFTAALLGDIIFTLSPKMRRLIKSNLTTALGIDEELAKKYSRRIFRYFSTNIIDFFRFDRYNEAWFKKNGEVIGLENIQKALSLKKGVIAVSAHMGNWEVGAYMTLLAGVSANGVWASHKNPKIEDFFLKPRLKKGLKVILTGGAMKKILAALAANELVYFMIDYSYSKRGVEIDFFNRKAIIPKGAAIAALKTNAAIVPVFTVRTGYMRHKIICGEMLEYSLSGDEAKDIASIMSVCIKSIENIIRQYPDQWLLFRKYWCD